MWGNFFVWASLGFYFLVVCCTIIVVLLENRQPVKTIAWILVLVALPVVGLLLFYFFGQDIRKERYISRKNIALLSRKSLTGYYSQSPCRLPSPYVRLIRFFERQNKSLPFSCDELVFYTEGTAFIEALLAEMKQARHHIHLEVYIFENDEVGRRVRDVLVEKAQAGVEVRLLYDDVGCLAVKQRFFDDMARYGVRVEGFMPVRFPRFTHKVNYRNHRKICVVDGRVGFVGGMNIADRYVGKQGLWRDTHLRISGAVYGLQRTFLMDWFFVSGNLITDGRYYPSLAPEPQGGGTLLQIVTSDPVAKWPDIMYGFTWIIQNAQRYVYIQSPYFMPTEPILVALQTAAVSGVDVRLMVPERPDTRWLRWANESYFSEILRAGVKVFRYRPGFLHSKCLIVDDALVSIGSSNMDFRSFESNFEVNAFVYDAKVACRARAFFEEDLLQCSQLVYSEWKKRGYLRRLRESFIRIFSPLL